MTLRVTMTLRVASAMLSVASWLTATSGATMAQPLQGLLDIQKGDCSSAGVNFTQLATGYRQTHDACYQRHFDGEGRSWLGSLMSSACVEIGATFGECLVQAGDYCRALRARDREIAACMAREEARQMARLSEERTRLQNVDEALSVTGELNEMRTRDGNPATEISAGLTEHALDLLGDRATPTLDAFTEAFQAFDRSEAGQSFLEQYVQDRAFIPGGSNSAQPLQPGAIPPEVQELLNLASEIAERDYSLPVGRDSTLSPEGQRWFQEAVRAALDGNPSMLLSAGDPGILADLQLQGIQNAPPEEFQPQSSEAALPSVSVIQNAPTVTEPGPIQTTVAPEPAVASESGPLTDYSQVEVLADRLSGWLGEYARCVRILPNELGPGMHGLLRVCDTNDVVVVLFWRHSHVGLQARHVYNVVANGRERPAFYTDADLLFACAIADQRHTEAFINRWLDRSRPHDDPSLNDPCYRTTLCVTNAELSPRRGPLPIEMIEQCRTR